MTNLHGEETRITVGDIGTLTRTKIGNWHIYQKRDRKLHYIHLSDRAAIPGLHEKLLSMTQALQKGFQGTSKFEALIFKKNSTDVHIDEKIVNNGEKVFLLTTMFYKSANNAAILAPKEWNTEGKAYVQP